MGRLLITSIEVNKYVCLLYDYDASTILLEPLNNRTGQEIFIAYSKLKFYITERGFQPKIHWIDNEAYKALKICDRKNHISHQLVPPDMHRINTAERDIRIRKNRFISGLPGTEKLFPMHLWDRLLDQAHVTLNMLRTSRHNPNISVHDMMDINCDFNKLPLAPQFTKVVLHEKPNRNCTWVHNGLQFWYIGPAVEHYQRYKVYITKTRAERITDTVEFLPENTNMPVISSANASTHAKIDLISALKNLVPYSAFASLGTEKLDGFGKLSDIFQGKITENAKLETTEA